MGTIADSKLLPLFSNIKHTDIANIKIKIIENAIDAIIAVVEDVPESDAAYFVNNENSVVSRLRRLLYEFED